MTAKKKVLASTKRGVARLTANLDGKYHGLTQKEAEDVFKKFETLEVVCIVQNCRSLAMVVRKSAKKKAEKLIAKMKKEKAKKNK